MKLIYSKDRVEEAKNICEKWYNGEKIDRTPFQFTVTAEVSKAWANGNPFTFKEVCENSDKAVQGQIMSMQHQFDTFPDCDYIPVFKMFHLGEGVLASMYGATQLIVENDPPYTKGRILKDIYEIDKLPTKIDVENSEWGKILKDQVLKFVDATNGEIPVAVSDYQSTYGTATKLLPNEELMLAMYDEPELVHKLFAIVTDGIIDLIETMKKWVGPDLLATNTSVPIPNKCGMVLWDDYVSVLNPALHKEFCVPYNKQLFERYGYGHLHTCGPYFPGYIDACLECKPRSMDVSIMRGMGKSKEDLMEFRRITAENNIVLFGNLEMNDVSIFNADKIKPDEEMITEFIKGGFFLNDGGTKEDGVAFTEMVNRINKIVFN